MHSLGTAIDADNLVKHYRHVTAVAGISLTVAAGETIGILGANGAGKSTLVEMIAGLRRPDSGSARVVGLDVRANRAQLRGLLGMQLQHALLHHALRVGELIRLYRSFYRRSRATDELLEMVGLVEQRDVKFDDLSGGQQQRLSVALALVGYPRVLILDELTTGLDPAARRRMWATVEAMQRDGVTILLVSHAMEEVERLCDRVALLAAGELIALDTPAGLVAGTGSHNLDEAFLTLTGERAGGA